MRKNAKLYRNALRGLLAALALGGLQVAHAGYAQLAAPAGYAAAAGGHTYAAAANDKIFGSVVHQAGGLTANVGGQAVKMPAAYRLAANAPRVAAAVAFAHPGIRTAVGIAGWLASAYFVWDAATGTWRKIENKVGGETVVWKYAGQEFSTASDACRFAYYRLISDTNRYSFAGARVYTNGVQAACDYKDTAIPNSSPSYFEGVTASKVQKPLECPPTSTETPAGCLTPALTQPEFVEDIIKKPMPSTVPQELPYPSPLPVEQPYINPLPNENPENRPLRVPTGQPVPIPNTNPQQYQQPYVDIVPAPTPDQPFRVDIKPGETISTSPNPIENPNPDSQDAPKPEEEQSLCEKHPDILACQKPELDTPDGEIPKTTKQVTYAEEGGFGGGSCPANLYSNIGGKNVMVYNWAETCGVVSTYLRPIILLLGAMGALFILIPGRDS